MPTIQSVGRAITRCNVVLTAEQITGDDSDAVDIISLLHCHAVATAIMPQG